MSHDHALALSEQYSAPLLQNGTNDCNSGQEARPTIGVTRARWWILMQYSLLTFNQVLLPPPPRVPASPRSRVGTGTFQALSSSITSPRTTSRKTLCRSHRLQQRPQFFLIFLYRQLFVNYGAIFFLLFSLPIAFLLDRPNCFRPAVLISAVCNLTGCVLRLFARSTSLYSIILLHASYAINAIGAPGPYQTPITKPLYNLINLSISRHFRPRPPRKRVVPAF